MVEVEAEEAINNGEVVVEVEAEEAVKIVHPCAALVLLWRIFSKEAVVAVGMMQPPVAGFVPWTISWRTFASAVDLSD